MFAKYFFIKELRVANYSGSGIADQKAGEPLIIDDLFIKRSEKKLWISFKLHHDKMALVYEYQLVGDFKFDTKIVIEENIPGREIECAVLGNDSPMASIPGEIIANQDFYSYDAKYMDTGSVAEIPAKISLKEQKNIQKLAKKVFQVLNCEGMSRVDFFLKKNGEVIVNEINTIPGFTNISMYPKLWEASGISISKLLDRLIELAIERFEKEKKLKTSVN